MTNWLLKKLYAAVEIKDGHIEYTFSKVPKGFLIDLKDIINEQNIKSGLLYIKMKNGLPHISFKGKISKSSRQRILNSWVVHRARYK